MVSLTILICMAASMVWLHLIVWVQVHVKTMPDGKQTLHGNGFVSIETALHTGKAGPAGLLILPRVCTVRSTTTAPAAPLQVLLHVCLLKY